MATKRLARCFAALGSKQLPVIAIFPAGDAYRPKKLTGMYTRDELARKLQSAGPVELTSPGLRGTLSRTVGSSRLPTKWQISRSLCLKQHAAAAGADVTDFIAIVTGLLQALADAIGVEGADDHDQVRRPY